MNRVAYRTTEIAIKVLAKVLKANSRFHDVSNIPEGPIIFVINHFTRLETLLLPYYLYNLVKRPIWSLADDGLFQGKLKSYFDRVGVVSTRDPQRDDLIVRTLITSEADWIIFPEGRMVKNKKLIRGNKFMIGDEERTRSPHTGAAWLALRAEVIRRILLQSGSGSDQVGPCSFYAGLREDDVVSEQSVKIVPVNLTYYPIRARENFLSGLAQRYIDEPSDRLIEELMAEGTMFLDGVDIDIRIARPLDMAAYTKHQVIEKLLADPGDADFEQCPKVGAYLQKCSRQVMRLYMERMYEATTVNHDHIQASLLRKRVFRPFGRMDLAGKTHLAVSRLQKHPDLQGKLHKSMQNGQAHMLTYDRCQTIEQFIDLGLDSGFLKEHGERLVKNRDIWDRAPSLHEARLANSAEVMANEIEPLKIVQRCLRRTAVVPDRLVPFVNGFNLYTLDRQLYRDERAAHAERNEIAYEFGRPFLLPAFSRRAGVVLLHSYLSVPEEMRECATLFQKKGLWVYGVRLPGHGTCSESLSTAELDDWRLAIDRGVALLSGVCRRVFLAGFSVGAMLALEFASHYRETAGVAAICPPHDLSDYSRRFMPTTDIWNRLLTRWKGNSSNQEYMVFEPENDAINYHRNPVAGVNQVGELLKGVRDRLEFVSQPVLVIGADDDQVIGADSADRVYERIGSRNKELLKFSASRHNIIYGNRSGMEQRVRDAVASFLVSNTD